MTEPEQGITARLARVHTLVEMLEQIAAPEVNAAARELVQTLLDLHRDGLGQLLAAFPAAEKTLHAVCARAPLLDGLLLLHDLHPLSLETRVRQALERIRPRLREARADVELLGIEDRRIRLDLREEEPSAPRALRVVIAEMLAEAVPDLQAIEFAGTPGPANGRLSLPLVEERSYTRRA